MFHIIPSGAALTEPDACSAQTSFTSPVSRSRRLPCYRCPHRLPTHGTRFLCPTAARSASAGMALAWTARLLCKFLALMRRTRSQRCVLYFALLSRFLRNLKRGSGRGQLETRLGALLTGKTCVVYDSDADRSSPAWQASALRAALQPAMGQLLEGRQPLRQYLHPLRCVSPALHR